MARFEKLNKEWAVKIPKAVAVAPSLWDCCNNTEASKLNGVSGT